MSAAPDLSQVLAVVRAFTLATLPGEVPTELIIQLSSGRRFRAPVPPPGIPLPADPGAAAPAPEDLTDCERDVLRVIEEADARMTTAKVLQTLQEQNCIHGDSTVIHALADLCQRKAKLTNRKDSRGRGYGLAEWS